MHQHTHNAVSQIGKEIDSALERAVPEASGAGTDLSTAIRHSLLAPGKRARGVLLMLAAGHGQRTRAEALAPACAVEMVHASSLIFDDLPSMDNATLRRGRPANHCEFGEATAILAGIALLNEAYTVISAEERLGGDCRADLTRMLSAAIGLNGLVAGQFADLHARAPMTGREIEAIHARKTGALFAVAAQMGGRVAGRSAADISVLRDFGMSIGVAFQTFDDLLDAVSSRESASKTVGHDGDKPTLVRLKGLEAAEQAAHTGMDRAIAQVSDLGPDGQLLAQFAGQLADILCAKMKQRPADGTDTASMS
jgi:geranylgeranyl diphosphate synthase, type II